MTNLDYTTLRLRGALDITRITGFTLHVGVNDHAHAVVEGEAGGDAFEQIRRSLAGREMSLLALDEDGEERPIFTGVVAKAALMGLGQYPQFRVELLSGTSLLDHEKWCRSFQDVGMTYEQLALQIMSEHTGGAAICTVGETEKLGCPVIQYRETDWEFLLRMASRCGGVVVPETRYGMPRIWFGFPERSYPCSFPEDKYSVGYSPRFWELGGEMEGYSRADFLYYDVESGQNCDLGWHTTFKGHDLLVMEKWAKLERGELRFTYRLGRPGLGWGRTIYNERIRGMSLLGEVLETERETLKLRLDIDEGRDPGGPYAYDWRPETGNMMYCMPQVGTRVSLYFPDHDEQHAMAVNCVRTNGSSCDRMSDPSKRAFVTEHGKELTLYPDSMALSGAGGKISLVDDRGLDIISEHGIMIAGRSVEFNAPTVSIIAEQSELMLAKGDTAALRKDPETWVPDTGFVVSHQFDLRSNSRTQVVGLEPQEHEPYDDQPQEGHFDWGGLVGNVIAGLAVVGSVALILATFGAAGPVVFAALSAGAAAVGVCALSDIGHGNVSDVGTYVFAGFTGAVTGAAFAGLSIAGQALGPLINCAKYGKAVVGVFKVSAFLGKGMALFDTFAIGDLLLNGENGYLYSLNAKLHSNNLYNAFQIGVSVTAVFIGGMSKTMTCFVAGTMVLTATGLVAIEQIKAGDKVISTDPETFETAEKTVLETYIRKDPKLIHLTVNGEEIVTTETHPFYVKDRGFVNAGELAVGDCLLDVNGNVLLVEDVQVEYTDEPTTVYNFQVEDFHTYYVGEHCVWVHNADCVIHPDGEIEITDWEGYPEDGPKPTGKLKLIDGDEYTKARDLANKANRRYHRQNPDCRGMDIHEVQPVKFGGSPENVSNKIPLSRSQHSRYTTFWNKIQAIAENSPPYN